MEKDDIELYLSKDIIQGEEVPFYIKWKNDEIISVDLKIKGFECINKIFNIKPEKDNKTLIFIDDLLYPGYIGGLLDTSHSDNPYSEAVLSCTIKFKNRDVLELEEKRILYSTKISIKDIPSYIVDIFDNPIIIELKGSTTVFINIESVENSDIILQIPEEILTVLEKVFVSLVESLSILKKEYPQYSDYIDIFIQPNEYMTENQLLEKINNEYGQIKYDNEFFEKFGMAVVTSFLSHTSLKDSFFRPMLEYFEANATKKAFLESPFLLLKIPQGGGLFKGYIYYENLLGEEGEPIPFETFIKSEKEALIPIKKVIEFRRV